MMSRTEEDFELELRSLPGVLNVGITHRDDGNVEAVTLVVFGQSPDATLGVGKQIVSLYFPDATVTVQDADEVLSTREADTSRVSFVRAEFHAEDGYCEVQLGHAGRVGIGRAESGPLIGGAEATLSALRDLRYDVPFSLMSVTNMSSSRDSPVVVTLRSLAHQGERFGIAQADEELVSAAKATLDALNRFLSMATTYG